MTRGRGARLSLRRRGLRPAGVGWKRRGNGRDPAARVAAIACAIVSRRDEFRPGCSSSLLQRSARLV